MIKSTFTASSIEQTNTAQIASKEELSIINDYHFLQFRHKEYQLLHFLYNNKNRIITKSALLELIWNMDMYVNSNTLEVHLSSLRRRLKDAHSSLCIQTIRGVGYRLVETTALPNQTSIFDF